jgi:hypothetical protein
LDCLKSKETIGSSDFEKKRRFTGILSGS